MFQKSLLRKKGQQFITDLSGWVPRMALTGLLGAVLLAGCAGAGANDNPVSSDTNQPPPAAGNKPAIAGVVSDESGMPLAEAAVMVEKGTSAVPEIAALTGEDGKYTWHVPAGTYTLKAHKDGYEDLSQEVTVKEGEQALLDFRLKKLP